MKTEPEAVREIYEIRLKNYEAERKLTLVELEAKRRADILRAEEAIEKYGLRVKTMV